MALVKVDGLPDGELYSTGEIAVGTTTVNCGFKPRFIFFADYPAYRTWRIAVFDETISETQYRYSYQRGNDGMVDMGNTSSVIESRTNNGFTIGNGITLNQARYWAVG